jgi:hypothetical protein
LLPLLNDHEAGLGVGGQLLSGLGITRLQVSEPSSLDFSQALPPQIKPGGAVILSHGHHRVWVKHLKGNPCAARNRTLMAPFCVKTRLRGWF